MCAVDIAVHYIPASAICQFETFSFFCARGPPSACRRLGRIILVHLCTIFSRFSPRPAILVHLCTIFSRFSPRPAILVHLCTIFPRSSPRPVILVHICTIFARSSPRPVILVHLCTIFPRSSPRPVILVHLCTIFARSGPQRLILVHICTIFPAPRNPSCAQNLRPRGHPPIWFRKTNGSSTFGNSDRVPNRPKIRYAR